MKQGFDVLEEFNSNDKIILDHMIDIIIELIHSYMDNDSLEYAFDKLKLHLKELRKTSKFKSISGHLKSINARSNQETLENIQSLLIDINEYLYLIKKDEAVVTSIKNGFGFCKNQARSGLYFSMIGLPADLSDGDILGNYSFFESKGGPQLLNSQRVGNIYKRISEELKNSR